MRALESRDGEGSKEKRKQEEIGPPFREENAAEPGMFLVPNVPKVQSSTTINPGILRNNCAAGQLYVRCTADDQDGMG